MEVMRSVATTVLGLAVFSVLPTDGKVICPWCDSSMQLRLMDCVYTEMITRPQLNMIPLSDIDDIKWQVITYSNSMVGLPYDVKKVKVDKKFVGTIVDIIKKNNCQHNYSIIYAISDLAGKCYSSVTGYDPEVVIQDVKAMVQDDMRKNTNQQNNFQSSWPQIPPPLNNPPVRPPANSFGNPSFVNNAPVNPLGSPPANSFNDSPFMNNSPLNPRGSSPVNSFNNPPFRNNAPLNPPVLPPMNPSSNPSFVNNAAGSSENLPSNDYKGQGQAKPDNANNQAPSDGLPDSSLQNDKESQDFQNLPNNAALASTASPEISSPSEDSKSTDSVSIDNSNWTTLSPNTEASEKKTTGNEKSDDEEPCDEKFKIVLYEKLINDERFCSFFEKLPISLTKPEVPKIINHAFKEYGIQKHFKEFSTFWGFDSRTLNKESTIKDWVEVISKNLKIILSRNDLLKGDCEEDGKKMAGYILDTFPGEPAASSTENTNQNYGNGETSTESNSNSSVQEENPPSNSTANVPAENNFNPERSTDSGNLSFPELNSKLSNIFKHDGSTEKNGENVPFSKLLSAFETESILRKLHLAAKNCISPSGFNFDKFFVSLLEVTKSIQKNHPDWSHDKCEKETYIAAVAVLTEVLQNTLKSQNDDTKSQASSNQPDSAVGSSDSQISNFGKQSDVPNDYILSSDDSTHPGPGTDFVSGNVPQPQQDFTDYEDGTGPENIQQSPNFPPYTGAVNYPNGNFQNNQFQPENLNNGYVAPSEARPVLPNGNSQNFPPQQYQDYDDGPVIPNGNSQNFPSQQYQDYDAGPVLPNGNSQNFPPQPYQDYDAGTPAAGPVLPNGNSQNFPPQSYQDYDTGVPATRPVIPNYNTQSQFDSNYNSGGPANGPVIPKW